jgi:hypothetical protein
MAGARRIYAVVEVLDPGLGDFDAGPVAPPVISLVTENMVSPSQAKLCPAPGSEPNVTDTRKTERKTEDQIG